MFLESVSLAKVDLQERSVPTTQAVFHALYPDLCYTDWEQALSESWPREVWEISTRSKT